MPAYMGDDGISPEQRKLYEACLEGSIKDIRGSIGSVGASQYIKDGMVPIHIVSCSGREDLQEILTFLLESGSDVNAQTKTDGDTILHLIPRHNIIRIAFPVVLKVLEYNPDVFIRNRHLRSPYDEAIALGFFELANVLDGSMNAQEAKEYYETGVGTMFGMKLVKAIMDSKEDAAKDCLKNGANANYVNEHGAAAIHYLFTHYEPPPENILPLLINAKADPNLRDYEGDNSLNLAIKSTKLRESGKMYKIVEQLLKKGAVSTIKDLDGRDALAIANRRDYKDIVKLIRKYRAGHLSDDEEQLASTSKDHPPPADIEPEPIKRQVTFGTLQDEDEDDEEEDNDILDDPNLDLHKPNELGLFPLHQAILRTDHAERNRLVSKLLDNGADISARALDSDEHDESGNTALHMSVARDQMGTVKLLLQYRPLYSVPNNEGLLPMDIAEENGNIEMMKLLEDYKRNTVDKKKAESSTCSIL